MIFRVIFSKKSQQIKLLRLHPRLDIIETGVICLNNCRKAEVMLTLR